MIPLTPTLLRAALPLLHHKELIPVFFQTEDGDLLRCQLLGPGEVFAETVKLARWFDPQMAAYNIEMGRVFVEDKWAQRLAAIAGYQDLSESARQTAIRRRRAQAEAFAIRAAGRGRRAVPVG